MVLKLIASLTVAAFMATQVAAQQFPEEEFPLDNPVVAIRGGCDRAVRQALEMTGGELLSVRPARNGKPICAVTVLVINAKGRPKKMRLRIPMDF
jgi:hypothetical protein